jgi:iron(III) transport system permease protein
LPFRPTASASIAAIDMASGAAISVAPVVRPKIGRDDLIARLALCALVAWLFVFMALPLWSLLSKSFQNRDGVFIGLTNYITYFSNPALSISIANSFYVSIATTLITIPLAFLYAYGLTRSCMKGKGVFRALALIPILAPSLLPAISFI